MAARFRIDQFGAGPGEGVLDRSRTDLVAGEPIELVVPDPVGGATYSWRIVYKFNSTEVLSSDTGTTSTITAPVSFCAFLIELTETIGLSATTRKRIAAVRGSKGLRPLVFGETANPTSHRDERNPDDSTDNEERDDLDGVAGEFSQNWAGWIEAMNEALLAVEAAGGGLRFTAIQTSDYTAAFGDHVLLGDGTPAPGVFLPPAALLENGQVAVTTLDPEGGSITPYAGDEIYPFPGLIGTASGECITLQSDGGTRWYIVATTNVGGGGGG